MNHGSAAARALLSITAAFVLNSAVGAQTVFSCQYRSEAQVKVYVARYRSEADLVVYKCAYRSEATGNEGRWFFERYRSSAKKRIFFVKYRSESDLVVFFADYRSEAGWRNRAKLHVME